jgi:tripartite-type tricarboxylate transporter receptor subunit TctC
MLKKGLIPAIILLIGVFIFTISGCSSTTTNTETKDAGNTVEKQETKAADNYPAKPMKWTVSSGAGGSADLNVRLFTKGIEKELGTPQIIENRGGSGGQIAWTVVFDSEPTGYSFGDLAMPHLSVTQATQGAPYSINDFEVFAITNIDPYVLNSQKDAPWKDLTEMIEYVRANPNKVKLGYAGGLGDMALGVIQSTFDIKFAAVKYDGGAAGRAAFLGGHLDLFFGPASDPALKDVSNALAVFSSVKNPHWPDALTVNEIVKPKYGKTLPDIISIKGLLSSAAFKKEYPDRWQKVYDALYKVSQSEDYKKAIKDAGIVDETVWIAGEDAKKILTEQDGIVKQVMGKK